jgi:hypothetical protein
MFGCRLGQSRKLNGRLEVDLQDLSPRGSWRAARSISAERDRDVGCGVSAYQKLNLAFACAIPSEA